MKGPVARDTKEMGGQRRRKAVKLTKSRKIVKGSFGLTTKTSGLILLK